MTKFKPSILLILLYFVSCGPKHLERVDGFWSDNDFIIELHHDTLSILHYSLNYKFEIIDKQVFLTKNLNNSDSRPDTLKYPFLLGKLNSDSIVINNFLYRENFTIKKLKPGKHDQMPIKIQFSSGYWSKGYDFELDSSGNFFITESSTRSFKTYMSKLSKKETKKVFYLSSLVDFKNLESEYVNKDCRDASRFGFIFYFKRETLETFIYCKSELASLLPLRYFLEYITFKTMKETNSLTCVQDKFYESRLLESQGDTIFQISYHSHFDSINYKLPTYNLEQLKSIVNKKYDFGEMNVCFNITINKSGKILNVKFDKDLKIDKRTIDQIKNVEPNFPAVYNGTKITLDYYDCVSFKK